MSSKGIHHITAVAGDPQQNFEFYTQVMGMRMVKKTVNFDDPSVYHLYYGNEKGDPGTILTFFPWDHLKDGKPDAGQVVAISFSVPTDAKAFWLSHLEEQGINFEDPFTRFGKEVIGLQDPNGLHLEIVMDPKANDLAGWDGGPVPSEFSIRGFHGATLAEKNYTKTGQLLEKHLGFKKTNQLDNRYLYETDAQLGATIEIIDQFDLHGREGKGTVHHIAFRAEDEQEQFDICQKLEFKGYYLTEIKDRQYFKSVYFHEPGGILFEIATDPPGFLIDEDLDELGTKLKLPEWLETHRHNIERELTKLTS